MGFAADSSPLNLNEEKAKFFADPSYNPQFEYLREFTPAELTEFGQPSEKYYQFARQSLVEFPAPAPLVYTITDQDQVYDAVMSLFNELGITEEIKFTFSKQIVSRCFVRVDEIAFRLPLQFTEVELHSLLDHEVQTHLLRRLNNKYQGLPNQRQSFDVLKTEEGLASLHTLLAKENKHMRRSWLNYVGIYLAQHTSFSDTYTQLLDLGATPEKAWFSTLRAKRGQQDTSHPGGNTRGLVYLEGAVEVWKWLKSPGNDPHDLYLGRIALNEVETFKPTAKTAGLIYPTFFKDINAYKQAIEEIGILNKFDIVVP